MVEMRRKDREMDEKFAYGIIDKVEFGTLATINEDNTPYCIPISFARHENKIYLHSAFQGTKINNIKANNSVTMSFVGDINIPFPNPESSKGVKGSGVFTTEYESAIIKGAASFIENDEEKILALRLLCEKYCPNNMQFFDEASNASLKNTCVIRIDIEEIKGKRKKYDSNKQEMKWGRME